MVHDSNSPLLSKDKSLTQFHFCCYDKILQKDKNLGEKEGYFSLQFLVAVHHCCEVKEKTENSQIHHIHSQEQREMDVYMLICLELCISTLTQLRTPNMPLIFGLDFSTLIDLIKTISTNMLTGEFNVDNSLLRLLSK